MTIQLVIDEAAMSRVAHVRAFALLHRRNMITMMQQMGKEDLVPGNDEKFCVDMFDGWKVVYTIEQQSIGWCQHLSMSIRQHGKQFLPTPNLVESAILPLFGLGPITQAVSVWEEQIADGKAINLLFKYDGPLP